MAVEAATERAMEAAKKRLIVAALRCCVQLGRIKTTSMYDLFEHKFVSF